MLTIGVDLSEVARVEKLVNRYGSRFCNRVFTPQEQAYCQGRATSLAGRVAVKEAVAKALGTGIGDVAWKDIEIINDKRGKPELVLHNQAKVLAEKSGLGQWSISLSHTDSLAIGFVVAIGEMQDGELDSR